jgi:putative transposase
LQRNTGTEENGSGYGSILSQEFITLSWTRHDEWCYGGFGKKSIEPHHPHLSVTRQTELLGLARRTAYYQPVNNPDTQALLKRDMDAIDAIYTDYPFYGYRRMRLELLDRYGTDLGRKRIRKVMQLLRLEAIYPKPNTSKPGEGTTHQVYPYLLRGVTASYPNHIWGVDSTYIKTAEGFVYLVAFKPLRGELGLERYVAEWIRTTGTPGCAVLCG